MVIVKNRIWRTLKNLLTLVADRDSNACKCSKNAEAPRTNFIDKKMFNSTIVSQNTAYKIMIEIHTFEKRWIAKI